MGWTPLTFGRQSKPGEWGYDGTNRLINAYAENMGAEGKVEWPIRSSPGLKLFGSAPAELPVRGMIEVNGTLYTCVGTALFRVDQGGSFNPNILGGVAGTQLIAMARNRRAPSPEIAIVVEGNTYIVVTDPVNPTFTAITDPDLPPAIDCGFVDGYILYAIQDGRVFVSGLEDAGSINALAFFTAEGSPDGLVGLGIRSREVFLFGEASIEVWANDGSNNPAPFSRSLGEFIQVGCGSRQSIVNFNQSLAFVDNKKSVRWINGYTAQVISSAAVERAIDDLADKSQITALTYHVPGAEVLQLSSPEWTWEYHLQVTDTGTVGLWNERESYRQNRYRGSVAADFAGMRVMGDNANGKLYEIDRKTFDDAGEPLIWTVRAPIQHNYPGRLEYNEFTADLIPGVGLNNQDPALSDPKAMVRYSDDGGHQWGNERQMPLHQIGEKGKRIKPLTRLGTDTGHGRTWEVSVSAAVCRGMNGAAANVEQLAP